jgi:phenylacetate-CoA ligase
MDVKAPIIRNVAYPAWVLKNRGARLKYLRELERSQFWSADEIRAFQWRRFAKLIDYAFAHNPFYRRKLEGAGLHPRDLRSLADISRIPTTTKQEVQEHGAEMISAGFRRSDLVRDMTGGSTGSPTVFYYDKDRRESRVASTMRHDRWAGWDIGERIAVLWGAPRDMVTSIPLTGRVRNAVLNRQRVLDMSSTDEDRMVRFALELVQFQPRVILAYASAATLFADVVERHGIGGISPKGIITSAEVLSEDGRRRVESTFGCRVYDRYGSREFALIGSECGHCPGLHVNAEYLLLEVLEDAGSGQVPGEIVITDLANFAMPLIRYRTMDAGSLDTSHPTCGRGLPLLSLKGGRMTDFLVAADGSRVSGIVVATYVITNIPGIRQVQFVQDRQCALTVNIVKGGGWTDATLMELRRRLYKFLGEPLEIAVVMKDLIPSEPSGKYRFSISTLSSSPLGPRTHRG